MKHIKLFENWAEEIKLDPCLDPSYKFENGANIYELKEKINDTPRHLSLSWTTGLPYNFRSFSDYDFWNKEYDTIAVNQGWSLYKEANNDNRTDFPLENCLGIPTIEYKLLLSGNKIKSLKGLENQEFSQFHFSDSFIENLKYFPKKVNSFHADQLPLLSLYGCNSKQVYTVMDDILCGVLYRTNRLSQYDNIDFYDIKLHADLFSRFNKNVSYTVENGKIESYIVPWHQIYHDPDDVENFEFLFLPFWNNSEIFRDKAKTMITDIDLGKLNKQELW